MVSESTTQAQSGWERRPRATRSLSAVAAVAVVGLIAAACGSSTPSASKSSPSDTQAPAGTTATTGASSQVVADATANTKVGGTILVNASGMTLYKFSADSAGKSACTGACATAWPPVTVATGITPKGGSGATGTFGTITRSGGTLQVTYDSDPLYTFSGDSAAGDTNGQNLTSDGGTWTVVTAKMTPTTKAPTTTKPSGGGYGY